MTIPPPDKPSEHAVQQTEMKIEVKSELASIAEAIGVLVAHMDETLPEERVKALVANVAADEHRSRLRLQVLILGLLCIAILVSGFGVAQSVSNGHTTKAAKTVADYVQNCLQHPEKLTDAQRAASCGTTGAGSQKLFLNYFNCVFLLQPGERTPQALNACITKATNGG